MNELCETAIKNRREYDNYTEEHLWNILEDAIDHRDERQRALERLIFGGDDEEDSGSDSDDKSRCLGAQRIARGG